MRILITNHWLKKAGGSETFTYAMAQELSLRGHVVECFTNVPGDISRRIKETFGVRIHTTTGTLRDYDLVLANHNTCVRAVKLANCGPIYQTCHGTTPRLEQPEPGAYKYIAISAEVCRHIAGAGFDCNAIIHNGINLIRFRPTQKLNRTPKFALSLAQSEDGNRIIAEACRQNGIKLITHNKHRNPRMDIENVMNKVDIVFTLGRGAYEALACGRNVAVFDWRKKYQGGLGDGMITPDNIDDFLDTNCSGRHNKLPLTVENINKAIAQYQPDAKINRVIAEERFDIRKAVDK